MSAAALPPVAPPKPAVAPSTPPPDPGSGKGPTPATADWLGESNSELDALDAGGDSTGQRKPAPKKAPKKPEEGGTAPEGEVTPPEGETHTEEAPPEGEVTPPAKPGAPEKPLTIPQLRKAYEETRKTVKTIETERNQLRTRLEELEKSGPVDAKPLQEKLTKLESRNKELEAEITYVNFEKSEEFQTKYFKPFVNAWDKALTDFKELTAENSDGTSRPATEQDLHRLANMKLGAARAEANRLFGDSADDVMFHVRRVRELSDAMETAKTEAQKTATTRAEEMKTQLAQAKQKKDALWVESNKALATKYPRWFAKDEADAEGNAVLDKGFALTDLLFAPATLSAEQIDLLPKSFAAELKSTGRLSPESQVRLHALLRNKAANHDRLARRLNAVTAELEEAKSALAEYEASEPGTGGSGSPGGGTIGSLIDDANAEIDKLNKTGRA